MHKTLKQETALPPRSSLKDQQRAFNAFKKEYNYTRPHEALKYKVPDDLYNPSTNRFPNKLPEVAYPTSFEVHEVCDMGTIRFETLRVFIAPALRGERIGLEVVSERQLRIHFCSAVIGVLDAYTGKVSQYKNPTPVETMGGCQIPQPLIPTQC